MQRDDGTTSFWQDTAGDAEQQRGQGGEGERHPHAQGGGQHAQEEDGEAREGDAVQHSVAVDDLDAGTRPKSWVQGGH
jgi:hypothetical protein